MGTDSGNLDWSGQVVAIQPRIRLLRSFDQRSHVYQGYVVHLAGTIGGDERPFSVAIGEAAQTKHQLRAGDRLTGECLPVADPRTEIAEFYKVSKLKVVEREPRVPADAPPWLVIPVPLSTYRERDHRRLDARTYEHKCATCVWGCRMAVEIIVDHWNPSSKRYRVETFCYGPVACPLYKAGPTRRVPGRNGMSYEEPDWIDADAVKHRRPDD
jgi:hypothetical protein